MKSTFLPGMGVGSCPQIAVKSYIDLKKHFFPINVRSSSELWNHYTSHSGGVQHLSCTSSPFSTCLTNLWIFLEVCVLFVWNDEEPVPNVYFKPAFLWPQDLCQ